MKITKTFWATEFRYGNKQPWDVSLDDGIFITRHKARNHIKEEVGADKSGTLQMRPVKLEKIT